MQWEALGEQSSRKRQCRAECRRGCERRYIMGRLIFRALDQGSEGCGEGQVQLATYLQRIILTSLLMGRRNSEHSGRSPKLVGF